MSFQETRERNYEVIILQTQTARLNPPNRNFGLGKNDTKSARNPRVTGLTTKEQLDLKILAQEQSLNVVCVWVHEEYTCVAMYIHDTWPKYLLGS